MVRRSTIGYCIFVEGNQVSWKSKKQNCVNRSVAQAECEILWVLQLLKEAGFKNLLLAKFWCENQAAIHIAFNLRFHELTKHIEIDCHFICEKIQQRIISTGHVKTGEQSGDIFTKALNETWVDYICYKLGMINIFAPI